VTDAPDTILSVPDTVTDAGEDFHWSVWTEDTQLTLVNVPWNSDYRDLVRFPTQTDLDAYIDGKPNLNYTNYSYLPFQRSVMIEAPITSVFKYNYVRAKNSLAPIPGDQQRSYYYFILEPTYISPETTMLTLQLDVWQTFGFDVAFGPSYVERGHIGIANQNAFNGYGRDYLTELEGFDLGGEYRTVHVETNSILNPGDGSADTPWVLICSTADLTVSPTDSNGGPLIQSAPPTFFQSTPSGPSWYYFKTEGDFIAFMESIATSPWIGQSIISITAIPPFTRYYPGMTEQTVTVNGQTLYKVPTQSPSPRSTAALPAWRDKSFIGNILGTRYAALKKFLTFPYMLIELTTWSGSPAVLKPEMWQDPDATVRELSAFVPPGQRVVMHPLRYNADAETRNAATETETDAGWDDYGEYLDLAVTISSFPTFALVNNMALSFLASNRNSLNFAFTNAAWDQQRAIAGAQAGADVANAGLSNIANQANIANNAQAGQTDIGVRQTVGLGILGAGGDLIGASGRNAAGAIVSGAGDAALSAAATATNVMAMMASSSLSQSARAQSAGANIGAGSLVRDTNQQYANFAANGDYAMARLGTIAKMQDARMTQPSTSGQVGGDAFNLINGTFGWSLRWKMPNLKVLRQIGDFWLRYGYAVHQYVTLPTDLMVMTKFTYWKLSETYLGVAPVPESFKQTIRGIFEKGVTVWRDPDDIGVIDWADNEPVAGISY
jgi:hypothetical protein